MNKQKRKINDNIPDDYISLLVIGFCTIVITVLDIFGFLDNLTWLSERIPKIILLLIGIMMLPISRSLYRFHGLVASLRRNPEIDVIEFEDTAEIYDYISKELLRAQISIEDITWGSYTGYRTSHEQDAYERYVTTLKKVCKKESVMYKEISSLSDSHYFKRSIDLLGYYSYHLGYYDLDLVKVPLNSFVIIDSKKVIIGFRRIPGQKQPLEGIKYLAIMNKEIVDFYRGYYDSLWQGAEKIKEANSINNIKLNSLKNKYGI